MAYYQFADGQGQPFGSCEVFYLIDDDKSGGAWYWHACCPGCMPDGDANGPFATKEEAKRDANVWEEKSPIETLCACLRSADDSPGDDAVRVSEILVPEQCAEISIGDKLYHLTIEELPDEDDTLRERPVVSPEQAAVPKANFAELRKVVAAMEKGFRDEVLSWGSHEYKAYNTFEVLSSDLSTRVIVLCHAQGLEDLFDQLGPWQGGDLLDWEQKAKVVRALKAAKTVMESMDVMLTEEVDIGEYMPKVYFQLCC